MRAASLERPSGRAGRASGGRAAARAAERGERRGGAAADRASSSAQGGAAALTCERSGREVVAHIRHEPSAGGRYRWLVPVRPVDPGRARVFPARRVFKPIAREGRHEDTGVGSLTSSRTPGCRPGHVPLLQPLQDVDERECPKILCKVGRVRRPFSPRQQWFTLGSGRALP
jgi:hypothetical protein